MHLRSIAVGALLLQSALALRHSKRHVRNDLVQRAVTKSNDGAQDITSAVEKTDVEVKTNELVVETSKAQATSVSAVISTQENIQQVSVEASPLPQETLLKSSGNGGNQGDTQPSKQPVTIVNTAQSLMANVAVTENALQATTSRSSEALPSTQTASPMSSDRSGKEQTVVPEKDIRPAVDTTFTIVQEAGPSSITTKTTQAATILSTTTTQEVQSTTTTVLQTSSSPSSSISHSSSTNTLVDDQSFTRTSTSRTSFSTSHSSSDLDITNTSSRTSTGPPTSTATSPPLDQSHTSSSTSRTLQQPPPEISPTSSTKPTITTQISADTTLVILSTKPGSEDGPSSSSSKPDNTPTSLTLPPNTSQVSFTTTRKFEPPPSSTSSSSPPGPPNSTPNSSTPAGSSTVSPATSKADSTANQPPFIPPGNTQQNTFTSTASLSLTSPPVTSLPPDNTQDTLTNTFSHPQQSQGTTHDDPKPTFTRTDQWDDDDDNNSSHQSWHSPTKSFENAGTSDSVATTRSISTGSISDTLTPSSQTYTRAVETNQSSINTKSPTQSQRPISQVTNPTSRQSFEQSTMTFVSSSSRPTASQGSSPVTSQASSTMKPVIPIFIGTKPITKDSSSHYVIGSQTLLPGSQISVDGDRISAAPSGGAIIINPVQPINPSASAVMIMNGKTIVAGEDGGFVMGDKTLFPGGAITQNGQVITLPNPDATPPPRAKLIVLGESTFIGTSGAFVMGSQTLTQGGAITSANGDVISLSPDGSAVVVNAAPRDTNTFRTVTAGLVSPDISSLDVAGQVLTKGGRITVGGDILSFAPTGTGVVVIGTVTVEGASPTKTNAATKAERFGTLEFGVLLGSLAARFWLF